MGVLKSLRHEHFVREYIRCGENGAEAYRRVSSRFPRKITGCKFDSAKVVAFQIWHRPEVQRRYLELREIMAKKSDITIEKVLSDIQEAFAMAKGMGKPSDMINAAMSQAKLVGLLRDRVEHGDVGDFDNMENISDILDKVGQEVGPEAALALSKAFGLDKAETAQEDDSLVQAIPPTDAVN